MTSPQPLSGILFAIYRLAYGQRGLAKRAATRLARGHAKIGHAFSRRLRRPRTL